MKEPLISVIIPIYNAEKYLDKCIESVIMQTYKNLDIILVDDCSPDNCPGMCDNWAKRDGRIRVIHRTNNSGVPSARNDGIEASKGEWLAFVDSDDWLDSDYFYEMIKQIGDEDCDVFVLSGFVKETNKGSKIKQGLSEVASYQKKDEIEMMMVRALISPKYKKTYPVISVPWNKLYKADFVKNDNTHEKIRFDKSIVAWDDAVFNFTLLSYANKIIEGTYVGYHYRIVEDSISHGFDINRPQKDRYYRDNLYSYMKEHSLDELLRQGILGGILTSVSYDLRLFYFHPNNAMTKRQINEEIQKLKKEPCVYEAVHGKSNAGYDYKRLVVKYLLRQPLIWPAKMIFKLIY